MHNIEIFSNYQLIKLDIPSPILQNIGLLTIFLIITLLTKHKTNTTFLDRTQTDQLKGIAILLVVLGHLWVHVSSIRAIPALQDYAVTLFLILSGFGLTISQTTKTINNKFIFRRFRRVIIPYWLITSLILVADFFLLNKAYSITDVMLTFAGINLSKNLKQIDYTRWYITLLLIYYMVYFLFNRYLNKAKALLGICAFSLVFCILNITKIFPLGAVDQIIAFPIGCLIAFYYETILHIFNRRIIELSVSMLFFLTSLVFLFPSQQPELYFKMLLLGMRAANSLLFCVLLIMLIRRIGDLGYSSYFLSFCGLISYEIYLIHGPLLIKYNPIIKLLAPDFILISFTLFLTLVLILSYSINKVLNPLVQKTVLQNRSL
jgi:peptidoglycan/LPS O-acetylase OafA/YrhL